MILPRICLLVKILSAICATSTRAFSVDRAGKKNSRLLSSSSTTAIYAAGKGFGGGAKSGGGGKGFGGSGSNSREKTYGERATSPIKDVIDTEAAMSEFFMSNEEWHPLFQNFAMNPSVPAWSFLGSTTQTQEFDFDNQQEQAVPWKRLNGIPTDEEQRQVLANVLDSMHTSLIDIPVDEATKEDDNDLHFLEEGRRILAISRFHVLPGVTGGSVESHDELFSTCWSELMELRLQNEVSTGSLIVLPDYDMADLKRFTDINLLRPLEWLGVQGDFEVTSLERGSPAIRFLHKLQDMPDEPWNDPDSATDGGAPIEIGPQ